MAEKDLVEKKLEDHNDVFADILNTLLFRKKYIYEKRLRSDPTESIYKSDQGKLHGQRRDTLKDYQGEASFIIAAFGIENQSRYDRTMPVRILGYDSAGYKAQVEQKRRKLHPVITIVLNFSNLAKQKGESITMCWVAQELIDKGEKQGENLMATLIQRLFADGRNEDVQKAVNDEQDRKKFYREYGLID